MIIVYRDVILADWYILLLTAAPLFVAQCAQLSCSTKFRHRSHTLLEIRGRRVLQAAFDLSMIASLETDISPHLGGDHSPVIPLPN